MNISIRILVFLVSFFISISPAFSATWDGGGVNALASNPDNWAGNVLPLYADMITFDATSEACSWDLDELYSVLTIDGGYTGAVTLNSTLTLSVLPLPETGQTSCYTSNGDPVNCNGTGQDGDYTGNPMSFTDNGNGTITDNVTGLMWRKCTYGQSGADCATGSATGTDWTTAGTRCSNLLGAGWRQPEDFELMLIADYEAYGPAINTTFFPNTQSDYYWSSNTYSGGSGSANTVHFYSGVTTPYTKTQTTVFTRCVWGMPAANAKAFTDNSDGTITDNVTALMWQKCSYGQNNDASCSGTPIERTWGFALVDCEGLSLGGFTDWRLPNIKELKSIADSTLWPSINSTFFPSSPQSTWWSSTTLIYLTTYAWGVNFGYGGGTVSLDKLGVNTYYVRCVR